MLFLKNFRYHKYFQELMGFILVVFNLAKFFVLHGGVK